jgi:DNA-binding transcriptional ArsR family regulator
MSGTDATVDWDEVFRALAAGTRRAVIQHLLAQSGKERVTNLPASITQADSIGALDDETVEADGGTDRDRAHLHLKHVHLPRLEAAGLIDWDRDADVVTVTSMAAQLPIGLVIPTVYQPPESTVAEVQSD